MFNFGNLVYVGSGDVLVVYFKDKGSQDLPPENLYNPRLQSIERHPVLSELKNKKKVLSINDKFHPHQVEHLQSCCQQLWRSYICLWHFYDFWAVLPWFLPEHLWCFCVYGFSFRDFGFCILGCTVCLAPSSESTRQPIEVRPNSLLINIFSASFSCIGYLGWMDLLLLFPVCVCQSV